MKNTRKFIIIVAIIILSAYTKVYAGSINVSFSGNDTVYVGDNIDLTVKVSDINGLANGLATFQADVSFDEGYLEFVKADDVSSKLSVSYGQKTKRFVALGMGGEYVASNEDLLKITFKAKTPGETTLNLSNTVVGDTSAIVHSANVSSKKVKIINKNNDNTPSTEPAKDNSSSNPTPSTDNSKKETTPKTSKSTNSTTKQPAKSSDATLSKLMVNNSKMNPSFNKDTTSYNVEVPSDVKTISVDYITTDSKAKAEIIGNTTLTDGVNTIQVVVEAEDGTKKTYTLNVTKSNETSSNKLVLLDIPEADNIYFNEDKYEYNLKVGNNVKKLTIDAIPKSKDSTVEILGNKKLHKGNNVVLVKVSDKNGFSSYYRLNVKKDDKVKLFGIDIIYWFIFLFGLLFILLFIILLFKRRKKEEDDEYKKVKMHREDLDKIKENSDIYDDVVTKDEIIEAIEEKNPKMLKMLLAQEEANKLKDELKEEEKESE